MANTGEAWLIKDGSDEATTAPASRNSENIYRPEVLETIEVKDFLTSLMTVVYPLLEESIDAISSELRALSLDLHGTRSAGIIASPKFVANRGGSLPA